jgi:hypothetical protein
MGHSPTAGLSFWDVRFQGERILWELSLQVGQRGEGGRRGERGLAAGTGAGWAVRACLACTQLVVSDHMCRGNGAA